MKKTMYLLTVLAFGAMACEEHTISEEVSFTETITRLDINLDSSEIYVTSGDDESGSVDYDVRYRGHEPKITTEVVDGVLRVRMDCRLSCDGDFIVKVPKSAAATLRVDSGNMEVEDLEGTVSLSADSGNIHVKNLSGKLTLSADSGDISGNVSSTNVSGGVDSGNISLRFDEEPDSIDLSADSGDLSLSVPEGTYDVRTRVDSGNVSMSSIVVDNAAASSIYLDVDSGNIRISGY